VNDYVLCVDDDKTILMSLKAELKRSFGTNYRFEIAESAEEAWEVIEDLIEEGHNTKVIISDWQMPGIKGDEFLIQVHKKYPEISKILLTGQADDEAVQRAVENANLLGCIPKPWIRSELVDLIKNKVLSSADNSSINN